MLCIRVLGSHLCDPITVPLVEHRIILVHVKWDMKANPRLELLDPDKDIWACYSIKRKTPVVSDFL